MRNRLAVILGAGASHDVRAVSTGIEHEDFKPPLANGIFEPRQSFKPILEKYPKAKTIASTINVRISQGEPLERVLRNLHDSSEEHIVRQFRQVPLFLQELFGQISYRYTTEAANYSFLINRLLGSEFEKLAFITLNYDLLLEKSLGPIAFGPGDKSVPTEPSFYLRPNRKWMLVKLHGSVNWGRRIKGVPRMASDEKLLDVVDKFAPVLDENLEREIRVLSNYQSRLWYGSLVYPAIVIPLEGKYQLACRNDHIDAVKEFLSSCPNFLVIGVSGKDQDLLDLLRDHVKQCAAFGIVSGSKEDVEEAKRNFFASVPQFEAAEVQKAHGVGFSQFILSGSFENFLTELKG